MEFAVPWNTHKNDSKVTVRLVTRSLAAGVRCRCKQNKIIFMRCAPKRVNHNRYHNRYHNHDDGKLSWWGLRRCSAVAL